MTSSRSDLPLARRPYRLRVNSDRGGATPEHTPVGLSPGADAAGNCTKSRRSGSGPAARRCEGQPAGLRVQTARRPPWRPRATCRSSGRRWQYTSRTKRGIGAEGTAAPTHYAAKNSLSTGVPRVEGLRRRDVPVEQAVVTARRHLAEGVVPDTAGGRGRRNRAAPQASLRAAALHAAKGSCTVTPRYARPRCRSAEYTVPAPASTAASRISASQYATCSATVRARASPAYPSVASALVTTSDVSGVTM